MISPDLNLYFLTHVSNEWVFYWEEKREPRVHARRMSGRIDRVVNLLVKFCSEVASETMNLTLRFLHLESVGRVLLQSRRCILLKVAQLLVVWVRQMPEGEHLLTVLTARKSCVIDLHHIG